MVSDKLNSSIRKVREQLQANRLKEAGDLLKTLAKKWPDNFEIYNLMGVLFFKLEDYKKAAQAFNRCLFFEPKNVLLLNNLAVSYQKIQN